jgi:hypothetical protein
MVHCCQQESSAEKRSQVAGREASAFATRHAPPATTAKSSLSTSEII